MRKKDMILKVLNKKMTAKEIAEKINSNLSYTYILLKMLELEGKVKRSEWIGEWLWEKK